VPFTVFSFLATPQHPPAPDAKDRRIDRTPLASCPQCSAATPAGALVPVRRTGSKLPGLLGVRKEYESPYETHFEILGSERSSKVIVRVHSAEYAR
jgi:hypothetical protein